MNTLSLTIPPQQVKKIIDGDTFAVYAFNVPGQEVIRLLDVNTPEKNQPGYQEAKTYLATWLMKGPFTLTTSKNDSFGRRLCQVIRDTENVSVLLNEQMKGV